MSLHLVPSKHSRVRFTPAGAVTGIGSLPSSSVTSAIQAVAEHSAEIPFWPQLPQLSESEDVIVQGLGIVADLIEPRNEGYGYQVRQGRIEPLLATLHRSGGELAAENAAGFSAFEEAVERGRFGSAVAFKGQIEGPITLSSYLFYRGRPFISDPALFAAIAFHTSQMICWQIDRLKSAGLPVLLFVDEPALCLEPPAGHAVSEENRLIALAAVLEDARSRGAHAGLHCCAARPFRRMFRAKPDILSFDAHMELESFFADSHAIDFVNRGGTVAYGLVPTRSGLNAVDAASMFIRWLEAASRAGDPQTFARNAMVTATCGLGLLDPSSIAASFSVAHRIGRLIGNLAGMTEPLFVAAE